jgi:hypothetical protein
VAFAALSKATHALINNAVAFCKNIYKVHEFVLNIPVATLNTFENNIQFSVS